eukprot:5399327-Alexandrium_andersonii.AAC.1
MALIQQMTAATAMSPASASSAALSAQQQAPVLGATPTDRAEKDKEERRDSKSRSRGRSPPKRDSDVLASA